MKPRAVQVPQLSLHRVGLQAGQDEGGPSRGAQRLRLVVNLVVHKPAGQRQDQGRGVLGRDPRADWRRPERDRVAPGAPVPSHLFAKLRSARTIPGRGEKNEALTERSPLGVAQSL